MNWSQEVVHKYTYIPTYIPIYLSMPAKT